VWGMACPSGAGKEKQRNGERIHAQAGTRGVAPIFRRMGGGRKLESTLALVSEPVWQMRRRPCAGAFSFSHAFVTFRFPSKLLNSATPKNRSYTFRLVKVFLTDLKTGCSAHTRSQIKGKKRQSAFRQGQKVLQRQARAPVQPTSRVALPSGPLMSK